MNQNTNMNKRPKPKGRKIIVIPQRTREKKKSRDKSDLGENFVAPDGGWGWVISVASGFSILVTFPILLQFGILFRKRFLDLGITGTQVTTIINTQQAAATCSAIFNGPLFRRFTFRQVGIFASLLLFAGLFLASMADSFILYIVTISLMFGIGRGLMFSSLTLAVNTYFNKKRRTAVALQYTVSGIGPIILPHLSNFLMTEYSVYGTVLFYAGLSLNNLLCALTFHPVKWYTKESDEKQCLSEPDLSSPSAVLAPKLTLEFDDDLSDENISRSQSFIGSLYSLNLDEGLLTAITPHNSFAITKPAQRVLLPKSTHEKTIEEELPDKDVENLPICKSIVKFLNLGLLKDLSFVNLTIGLSIINITGLNFIFLTPFILDEFGFNKVHIAFAMSILALCDIFGRFLIPFTTGRLKHDNKTILLCALAAMCVGRTVLIYSRSFEVVAVCFGFLGLTVAINVVFWNLILPNYVDLKKLPAAIGLQRTIMGVLTLICGPFIGLIRDISSYVNVLHWMNAMCFLVILSWWGEHFYRKRKEPLSKDKETKRTQN